MSSNPVLNIDPFGDMAINGQKYEPNTPQYATVLENVTVSSTKSKTLPANGISTIRLTSCHIPKENVEAAQELWWYNVTKDLDKQNGQVMPPRSFLTGASVPKASLDAV